ncbi:MAG: MarR family transcriptional regulator [Treponema sp.]|jgi:DNA-binding MarR family transcriptional regulator|nr:MarR family transcriptional regulator [Treponema sp.]
MDYDISSTISLVSHIHSASADFLKVRLAEKGLPDFASSHGFILFQLSRKTKLTMSEIATRINRDKSTTTVLIRKLEKAGFVKSEVSPADSRSKFIMLTEKGKEYNKVTDGLSKELISTFYRGFSEAEKQQVFALLSRISDNFKKPAVTA